MMAISLSRSMTTRLEMRLRGNEIVGSVVLKEARRSSEL